MNRKILSMSEGWRIHRIKTVNIGSIPQIWILSDIFKNRNETILIASNFIDYHFQSGDSPYFLWSDSPPLSGGSKGALAGGLLSIPFLPSAFSTICKTAPIIGRTINTAMKIAQKGCSLRNRSNDSGMAECSQRLLSGQEANLFRNHAATIRI